MGFNSGFKGLIREIISNLIDSISILKPTNKVEFVRKGILYVPPLN